jgi:hypothetical protein
LHIKQNSSSVQDSNFFLSSQDKRDVKDEMKRKRERERYFETRYD